MTELTRKEELDIAHMKQKVLAQIDSNLAMIGVILLEAADLSVMKLDRINAARREYPKVT